MNQIPDDHNCSEFSADTIITRHHNTSQVIIPHKWSGERTVENASDNLYDLFLSTFISEYILQKIRYRYRLKPTTRERRQGREGNVYYASNRTHSR